MRSFYRFALIFFFQTFSSELYAQSCTCGAVTTYTVNLTANPNNTYTVSTTRNGLCCGASAPDRCIRFIVYVHPQATEVGFNVSNPSPPGGAFYQVNCGTPTSLGTPLCLSGTYTFCLTYCKAGGDSPTYKISSSKGFGTGPDITVRQNCAGLLSVNGLSESSITWTSVFPGAQGSYNSYLSCLSGCDTTYVTPTAGAPAFIDYKVCGTRTGCTSGTYCDTIRVNTVSGMTVTITPSAPVICTPGPNATITANASGGSSPYTYSWNTGGTTSAISAGVGTYTVSVTDATSCPAVTQTVAVTSAPTPSAPILGSNSPMCVGQTLSLTSNTISGATYSWSGPNSFTSSLEDPTIAAITTSGAGTYSATVTVNGCTSPAGTTSVTVNTLPAAPTAGSNSPVCSGQTLSLAANTIAGATYFWSGPNGFTSSLEDPIITSISTAASGTYSVWVTVNGCTGPSRTTSVTINQTPTAPTASSTSPVCSGQTLSLAASSIAGATYSWNGPNGFTSALQNPTIGSVTTAASGTYSVIATVNGCASPVGTTSVTVNPIPAAPTIGSNSTVCSGNTLSLTSNTYSGATYNWSGPNSFTSSLEDPTISGVTTAASGTYSLSVTVLGCVSSTSTTSVSVNQTPSAPVPGSNSTVCSGQTLSLTSNTIAGATYLWSGPNGFNSSLEDPTIANVGTANAGTYSVYVTVGGCIGPTATTDVVINPTPSAPVPGSNSTVCAGQTLSLTSNTIAGATYSWSGPNGFTSSLEDPTISSVTTSATGTYSVNVTVGGCTGPTATTSVTVNPIPAAPIAGSNSTVCSGQTLSLTSNTISGATYFWSGPNGFTSSLEDPTIASVTTAAAGTYSVYVTVGGCVSPTATTVVSINPIPSAPLPGNNSPLCVGQTLSLTSNTISGATYNWSGPNGFLSSLQNPTIASIGTVNAGTYSLTVTVGGCASSLAVTTVTVNPIPAAPTPGSNSPICSGQILSLTSNTVSGATYNWSGPNGFTSSLEDPTITSVSTAGAGTYSLSVIVNGCVSSTATTSITVNPTPDAPSAGSNSPMCTGANLSLTANTIGGATYNWIGPNGFTSTLEDPVISSVGTANAGTYSVTATVTGCTSVPGTTSVTISPPPAAPSAGSNSPVCEGYTLSLTANTIGGATYNWNGPNGFTSTSEDPTISSITTAGAGTYSVTVTVGGCTGPAGITTVTVEVSPASPTPGSNSPVCSGNTLSLTASSTGVSYNWTGPNGFTSTLQNPTITSVTTSSSGTYSVTATGTNGCVSTPPNTIGVTINQTPSAPVAGNDSPLCTGQTVSLTASTISGATYSWSGPNSFTSTLQNPTIPNLSTADEGTYSVTATVAGCTGPAATTTVIVDNTPPTPVAGSNAPLCTGATMSLTASNISMATYNWSGPNGFTSTLQNPTITGVTTANAGTYSVTATVDGCTGDPGTTSVSISVNPTPPTPVVGSNSPICVGEDLSLTSSTISSVSYSWTGPNGFTSSLEDPVITNASTAASGTYSVIASYTTGCSSPVVTTSPVTVNSIPVTPIAGSNGPLCTGVTLSLTASTIAGATYNWIGPDGFTSTLQNPTIGSVSTDNAGTYSVTATVNGCTSPAGTVSVAINPPQTPTVTGTSPVCTGQTLSLNANTVAGATYSWTGPNSFSSTLQNPTISAVTLAASGTYSLIINLGGCIGPVGTVSITVNATPTTPVAASNSPVCDGFNLSLTSSTVTGTTYSWSGPNGFTSTLEDPTPFAVTTASAGTYSVNVTSTANGCVSNTATVNVVVNTIPSAPSPAGNNSPICSGQTLSLNATTVGGATYNWNGPLSFTSTSQNPTITAAGTNRSGTYSVTATVNGCTSPVATTTVTIHETPSAPSASASPNPICNGDDLTLSASSAGSTYLWTGPNNFTSTSQSTIITGISSAQAGTYSVTATSSEGCTGPAGIVSVTVTSLPSAPTSGSNSPVCSGNTLSLTASIISGATYLWSGPNGFTSTLQNPTISSVSTNETGTYSVTATVSGCTGPAGTTSVTINQTPSAPVAGNNSPVCSGNTLSLTASTVGSSTYSWNGPNGFTSASHNPTIGSVTTLASGIYSVTATENGCTSPAGTTSVTINQTPSTPTAGSNSPVCSGQNLSLTASAISGATYSWNGPNGFTSTSQNSVISGVSTDEAGTYTVNATVNGCTSSNSITSVVVNQTPSAPSAGSNSPVCSGQTLSLNASAIAGATYSWSGPLSFTSTSQNPTIANASTGTSGTYSVTVTVNGCTGPAGTTSVTVNPTPSITAGGSSPVCEGNTISLNVTTVGGASYSWSGPGSFTSTLQNPTISSATTTHAGNYSVTATSSAGCVSNTSVKNIVITPTIFVNAGVDQTLCANNATITFAGVVSGGTTTGIWSTTGTGSFIPGNTSLNGNYVPSSADTAAGALTFTLTSTNNGGCSSQTDVMTVTFIDIPVANAGINQTVCANNPNVSLNGSVSGTATGGMWSSSGGGTFLPDNITLSATYIPDATDTANGNVLIMLTTTGVGLCSPVTDTMVVTITNAPLVNAGSNISVCTNNPNVFLNGSSSTGNGIWTTLGTGSFTPTATALTTTYVPSPADIANGNVILVLTSTSNGNCNPEDDSITVFFTPPPTVNAGSDQTVCANNANVPLNGTSSTGSGIWTTSGSGTFSPNASTLNAIYNPSTADTASGNVILTLTTTNNGGCIAVTDQLTITITDAPTANAGADQTVCANNASMTLNGSYTVAGGAVWTTSGSGTFSPDNITMNATYMPSSSDTAAGIVTFTLSTTGNGQCNAVTDIMVLTISNAPLVNTGINTVACKNNPNVPLNGISSTGSGIWTTLGTGTFVPNATTLNATYNSSAADTTAGSVTLILTSTNNGGCLPEDDTLIITYIDKPVVFAGNDTVVCSNNATVYLSGYSNTGSGMWSTTGSGNLANASSLITTYNPSSGDKNIGFVKIYLTTTNNGTCNPVKDSMIVTFSPSPTANAGTDQTVCANNAIVTLNGSFTISSGAGWTTLGSGTFSPDTFSMNTTYIPSATDTAAGSVAIVLTTTGNGGCLPERDTMIITITDAPLVNAGSNQIICISNPVATLTGTSTTGSGIWTTLGSGTFGNASALATTYTASPADTTAGTVTLVLTSTNNGLCHSVSDTVVLFFQAIPTVNAGADQTVCANNSTVTITGTSSTGWAQWTSSGTGTFFPNDSALSATYIPSVGDISSGNIYIKLTSRYGCVPVSDSLLVTITASPFVDAGANQTVCAGTMTVSLNGWVTGGATTGQWSSSGSGTFSPSNTTLNAIYNLSPADSALGTVTLTLTSTNNGNCFAVSDQIVISVMQPPIANAGPDTSICGIQINLYGSITGGSGTGYWTTVPPNSGAFSPDSTVLNALFAPLPGDTHIVLMLTSSNNGPCPVSRDTMELTIQPAPASNAGNDLFICKNNLSVQLNGQVFYTTTGQWTTTGSGTFSPSPDSLNVVYIPSSSDTSAGSVALVLTTTGKPECIHNSDTMVVFFTPPPFVHAGNNILLCEGDSFAVLNGSISGGSSTGQWSTLGDGYFYPNDSILNGTYILGPADTAAGTVTLLLTSTNNGACHAVTDTVVINIIPIPMVNAGSDLTVCANNATVTLTGNVFGGTTTGFWSTNGSGSFLPDSSVLNATYTPSAADTATGIITFVLTSTQGCRTVTDTMILTITDAPAPNAGVDISICEGTSLTLNGSINAASTGAQWTTSGSGIFIPNDSTLNATYTPSPADVMSGTVTFILTTTGNGHCLAMSDTMILTIAKAPIAGFSHSKICTGQQITFTDTSFTVGLNDSIVSWNWTIDGGTDIVQHPTHTYFISGTDSVVLIVTTNIGCTDTAVHIVNINPTPVANFTFATSCQFDSVYFTDISSISAGNITSWNWNFGDGDTSILQHPAHYYDSIGTFTVVLVVTSDSGCSAIFTDTVTPVKGIIGGFSSTGNCLFEFTFTDTSQIAVGDSIINCFWDFGDGNQVNGTCNPTNIYSGPGTYTVIHTVTTSVGCVDTTINTITISPLAIADFTPQSGTYNVGTSIQFIDLSQNATSWFWNFGDGSTDTVQNPVHQFNQNGIMEITLVVTNPDGCPDTAKYSLIFNTSVVVVPSAFTPNGDGVNDILKVLGGPLKEMDWRIYNEWGNEIFRSTDQNIGWDGKYKGKIQVANRYVYTLKGKTYDNEDINFSGEVTILR